MKIVLVSGARPNYMKIAPIVWAIRKMNQHNSVVETVLVHTGQHYDRQLFEVFFQELDLPAPDYSLGVGAGSHAFQTAEVMKRIEPILEKECPSLVLVVGDVNSTLAAALTAAKLQIPIAHVESGLRSFDRTMPEEINRIVTDTLSDYLFVTEEGGTKNLLDEGTDPGKIFFVGNVMIDSLQKTRQLWELSNVRDRLGLKSKEYGVVTLHRPSNVDNPDSLLGIMDALAQVAKDIPIIFPVHPRTRKELNCLTSARPGMNLRSGPVEANGIYGMDPLGYHDFMALIAGARIILTDSGGIQEETTFLNVPCLTLRHNTERPVTVTHGTNRIIGTTPAAIVEEASQVLRGPRPALPPPPLWDGRAAERILAVLQDRMANPNAATFASNARENQLA